MKFCTNMYLDNLYKPIECQGQRSRSHGFLCVFSLLDIRGQYLALSKGFTCLLLIPTDSQGSNTECFLVITSDTILSLLWKYPPVVGSFWFWYTLLLPPEKNPWIATCNMTIKLQVLHNKGKVTKVWACRRNSGIYSADNKQQPICTNKYITHHKCAQKQKKTPKRRREKEKERDLTETGLLHWSQFSA